MPVGRDQFVNRETFRPRHLHKNAATIEHYRMNRVRNQIVQVAQGLGADPQCRQRLDLFVAEGRCQKLDHRFRAALPPFPNLPVVQSGKRVEFERLEDRAGILFHLVFQGNREPFETGEINVAGLGQFLVVHAHPEFALVEAVGRCPDEGAAKPEYPCLGKGEKDRSSVAVGGDEAFGTQRPCKPDHPLPARFSAGLQCFRGAKLACVS